MNSETTVHKVRILWKTGAKSPKTCGDTHMASGCLSLQQHSHSLRSLLLALNQAANCSSIEMKMALSMQTQHSGNGWSFS